MDVLKDLRGLGGEATPLEKAAADEIERLREYVAHLAVPVGWKLVPVRATEEMLDAAEKAEADFNAAESGVWLGLQSYYQAMVQAAPTMTPNTISQS